MIFTRICIHSIMFFFTLHCRKQQKKSIRITGNGTELETDFFFTIALLRINPSSVLFGPKFWQCNCICICLTREIPVCSLVRSCAVTLGSCDCHVKSHSQSFWTSWASFPFRGQSMQKKHCTHDIHKSCLSLTRLQAIWEIFP